MRYQDIQLLAHKSWHFVVLKYMGVKNVLNFFKNKEKKPS